MPLTGQPAETTPACTGSVRIRSSKASSVCFCTGLQQPPALWDRKKDLLLLFYAVELKFKRYFPAAVKSFS